MYVQGGVLSPDGHCRPFDADAQGTVKGNGVGVIVLKRLADALREGDTIHAIVKGSAINNDGARKAGFTAPSEDGQVEVLAEAMAMADVDPETITYVETHGTGTRLGDQIEVAALTRAFRACTDAEGFCGLGSVKSNIGHLDAAAGIAGLIKTVLALKNKMIPPSLHFVQPNPEIGLAGSPFYVNATLREWQADGHPRRAGVSAFGLGGTNAHIVLEEAPPPEPAGESRPWQLILLSAKTDSALETATRNLAEYLKQHPAAELADVAYTLKVGRKAFDHRRVLVCQNVDSAVAALETQDSASILTGVHEISERPVAFMFPGMGDQYVNMALGLYQSEPTFRAHIDHCSDILKAYPGLSLRETLYPVKQADKATREPDLALRPASSTIDLQGMLQRGKEQTDEATQRLNQASLAHPALFAVEYSLAQLLMEWGVCPQAMIGHSVGEYVAACLSGVLSLESALGLVAQRAKMVQEMPGGAMLAVPLSEKNVQSLLGDELSLSAVNGNSSCVIAGPTEAIIALEDSLAKKDIAYRRVQTSHAFHSKMLEPMVDPFIELVRTVELRTPEIPYVSNVTGTWITADQATDPAYWAQHLCQPVRFADGVDVLWQEPEQVLLQVGPGQTLSSLVIQHWGGGSAVERVLPSLPYAHDRQPDKAFLLTTLGRLWLSGVAVDWSRFYAGEHRHRISLPTYPLERKRYWIDPAERERAARARQVSPEEKLHLDDWFYLPSWKATVPPPPFNPQERTEQKQHWLVFTDKRGIGAGITEQLEHAKQDVISVLIGRDFCRVDDQTYTVNPRNQSDYYALIEDLGASDRIPDRIVHLWSLRPGQGEQPETESFEATQNTGFYSLLFLGQALGKQVVTKPLHLFVVSSGMCEAGGDAVCPEQATLLGPCKVIPQEYTNVVCRNIDVVIPEPASWQEKRLVGQLLAEVTTRSPDVVVAYRDHHRWAQDFEAIKVDIATRRSMPLREKGVYLITGGLGMIGLTLARFLAESVQARLVLTSRSGLPARAEWEQWLASHDDEDLVGERIKAVQRLEKLGNVLIVSADVADQQQMRAAIAETRAKFGEINGVIHAAGIIAPETFTTIADTDRGHCELHFRPKIQGLCVLDRVLQEHGERLDFCLLLSSLSTVLGGLGFVAYASANAFLDAFAYRHNSSNSEAWICVDWDGGATPAETVQAFRRILSMGPVTRVVVSSRDLKANIDKWIKLKDLWEKDAETVKSLHLRPNLQSPYVAPGSKVEQEIASIWQELLGIAQVGTHDNFFQLGGNSLLGTLLASELRKEFQVQVPLDMLFAAPTVAALAQEVEKARSGDAEALSPSIKRASRTARHVRVSSSGTLTLADALPREEEQR
jgi:acyl transferase domain-containing protein